MLWDVLFKFIMNLDHLKFEPCSIFFDKTEILTLVIGQCECVIAINNSRPAKSYFQLYLLLG